MRRKKRCPKWAALFLWVNTATDLMTRAMNFLAVWCSHFMMSRLKADGQYLFYLNKNLETLLAYQLMRHKLGTDSAGDVLVYEETDNTYYNGVGRSRSGEYIMMYHSNTDTTEFQLLAADNPLGTFKPFLSRETGHGPAPPTPAHSFVALQQALSALHNLTATILI